MTTATESPRLTEKEIEYGRRLREDLPFYSRHNLKIKDKAGRIVPLVFNRAQQYIHDRIEDQKRRTGMVRVIILKARQEGASTYVEARLFHKTTWNFGISSFILSHHSDTTEKLFNMVDRFYSNVPGPAKPKADTKNRRRLIFEEIQGDYSIGTAGSEDIGRGGTVQLFHGSEVAFWPNTGEIVTGVLQSVPDIPGTEVILESTANGMGNLFYRKCRAAIDGLGDYELIFVPWFWMDEYRRAVGEDFELTPEEQELKKIYDLDDEQIVWRRNKIIELGEGDVKKGTAEFKREYPSNPDEAFQASGNSLIDGEKVMLARKSTVRDPHAPLVGGADTGRGLNKNPYTKTKANSYGTAQGDNAALTIRRGREIMKCFEYDDMDEARFAGKIMAFIDNYHMDKFFIDVTNGWGVYDICVRDGYEDKVIPVHFGSAAIEEDRYTNKRAEMWGNMMEWFHNENVSCPDDESFHAEVTCVPAFKTNARGLKYLISKDKIVEDFGKSPNIGDSAALTFAFPVKKSELEQRSKSRIQKPSQLKTLNRIRSKPNRQTELTVIGRI